ncbi:MAG: hypothetical protein FJ295_16510 [Planctomycetes bacterium]|nr:hypothetical protein [Planctomycetota bacterium]
MIDSRNAAILSPSPSAGTGSPADDWRQVTALTATAGVGLTSLFLASRRVAGALHGDGGWRLVVAIGALFALLWLARHWSRDFWRTPGRQPSLFDWRRFPVGELFATAVACTLGLSLTFANATSLGLLALLLVEEWASWTGYRNSRGTSSPISRPIWTQQYERGPAENNGETIRATLRGRFLDRDRSLQLHLGFCPPLADVPHVEVRQLSGPPVQIQIGQCQRFGVRLDLRRDRPEPNPCDVSLLLLARDQRAANLARGVCEASGEASGGRGGEGSGVASIGDSGQGGFSLRRGG